MSRMARPVPGGRVFQQVVCLRFFDKGYPTERFYKIIAYNLREGGALIILVVDYEYSSF